MAPTPTYIETVRNNNESESDNGKISFPYKIQDIDEKTNNELLELFTGN